MEKLDNIVNENSNTYHTTIKMKLVDAKDNKYIDLKNKLMIKVLNLNYYYYYYFYSYHESGFLSHIYIKVNRLFTPVDDC